MPRAISVDLRQRVLAAYDGGMRPADIVRQFQVKQWWFFNLVRERAQRGTIEPLPPSGGRPRSLAGREQALLDQVAQQPDLTLEELRNKLKLRVSLTTLWRALQAIDLTFKKNT